MKKAPLLLICQLMVVLAAFPQSSYTPFVIEGAHWQIDMSICDALGTCDAGDPGNYFEDTYHNFYKLEGDTTINSVTYKKLLYSYWAACDNCASHGIPGWRGSQPYQLYALLKEDTNAKKVYWKPISLPKCGSDSLFLDFSHQVGDTFGLGFTISSDQLYCDSGAFSADSADNSGFENYRVKTTYFYNYVNNWGPYGNTGNLRLFEGIGFSYGFTIDYAGGDANSQGSVLISYCVGNDSICPTVIPTSINTVSPVDLGITVFPNPGSDIITIKCSQSQIIRVDIQDVNGCKILSSGNKEINISSLSPAMYFIEVSTNLGIARKRLVKI